MKKASAAKNTEVFADALRGHSAPRGRILRYRGNIHLTTTSSGRFTHLFFLQIALFQGWIPLQVVDSLSFFFSSHWYALKVLLRTIRGPFCGLEYLWQSLTTSRNRQPGGKHEEDSQRPPGLNHRSVPLVRLAEQG